MNDNKQSAISSEQSATERIRAWRKNNLFESRAKDIIVKANRRARKTKNGGNITLEQWEEIKSRYGNKCLRCGRNDVILTMDHVMPISLGGNSNPDNIQPLCRSCNSSKKDKHHDYRSF